MNNKNNGLPPKVKVELFTKRKILASPRIVDFLQNRDIRCLKDQDINEKITPFSQVFKDLKTKNLFTPNHAWEISYRFKNSSGIVKIHLHNKFDPEKPSFIYHHGLGEIYFPVQMYFVFDRTFSDKFNLFSIKAGHHDKFSDVINSYINNITNFEAGIAGSLTAVEEIIALNKKLSQKPSLVCGISLGGIVASLHYYYNNTADLYFPTISHPDLSKILLDPVYESIIPKQKELQKNTSFINCFQIEKQLLNKSKNKIFPILGKLDMTINYRDSQKWWKGYNIMALDTGHTSIFVKKKEIEDYILDKLSQI